MPQITRPNGTGNEIQSGANISIGAAASSGEGLGAIGNAAVQFASEYESVSRQQLQATFQQADAIQAQGVEVSRQEQLALQAKALYDKGKQAENDALVQNRLSEAYTAFLGHKAVRETQVIDKDGNPTSSSLVSDLNTIGNTLKESIGRTIKDPVAAAQFRTQFDDYLLKQSISAYSKANEQQTAFAEKSLNLSLNSLLKQAGQDDLSQVKTYENQAISYLNNAVNSGLITAQQRDAQVADFTTSLREASIEHAVRTDRTQGAAIADTSAEKLGISKEKKEQFDNIYEAALKEDERRANQAFEMQSIDQKVEVANLYEDALVKIKSGVFREDDLVAAKDKVSPEMYKDLEANFLTANGQREAEMTVMSEIADKVTTGQSLNNYTDKELDKFYEYTVKKYEDQKGEPATLAEKARLANSLPEHIKDFEKELKATTLAGDPAKAKDIMEAYTYLKDTKSKTLNEVGNQSTHVLEHAAVLMKNGGLSAESAYKQAIEVYKNTDTVVRNANVKAFQDEDAFTVDNISETTSDTLEGAEGTFGKNYVDEDTVRAFRQLAASNYAIYGDKETALQYAKANLEKTHGVSTVNGDSQYMFAPPEMFYGKQFTSEKLRSQLLTDVEGSVPKGTVLKSIKVVATPETITSARDPNTNEPVNAPTWMIQYEDENGEDQVLIDHKTMQPVLWSPVELKNPVNTTSQAISIDTPIDPITGATQ